MTTTRAAEYAVPSASTTSTPSARGTIARTGERSRRTAPWATRAALHRGRAACGGHDRRCAPGRAPRCPRAGRAAASGRATSSTSSTSKGTGCAAIDGRVVVDGDGGAGGEEVEAAGDRHEGLAGLGLERGPVVVGDEGQVDVLGRVVAVPQDPARGRARRRARGRARTARARAPTGRGARRATRSTSRGRRARSPRGRRSQPRDPPSVRSRSRRGSSQRRMSSEASSIGAYQPSR